MATILVDNRNIRNIFCEMLSSSPQQPIPIRVLCISAQSGKGKSTLVDYFMEHCQEHNVTPIRVDFDAFQISDEMELMDTVIKQFGNIKNSIPLFPNYYEALERLAFTLHSNTVIENVQFINTQIGTICIQKGDYKLKTQLWYLENAFFQDLKRAPQLLKRKIVFFLDAFERAEKEIQSWINNKLILSKCLGSQVLFVLAGQNDFIFSPRTKDTYGIRSYHLPDAYEFEDWIEYGKQLHIQDTGLIERCYRCWRGDPFYMSITLRPFAN